MKLLEVAGLAVRYGRSVALSGVSIAVPEGETVCLLGANGAGKSTLLNAISGVLPKTAGTVRFDGEDITRLPPHRIVRRGIAHVPERRDLFPDMTVRENLMMGAYVRSDGKVGADLEEAFGYFPVLAERRWQIASTLSGGEQQMLAIARGLMSRPRLMLLDEPSLGLAPRVLEVIFDILPAISRDRRMAIFLVEQNTQLALSIASYGYILATGRLVAEGTTAALVRSDLVRQSYLGIVEEKEATA